MFTGTITAYKPGPGNSAILTISVTFTNGGKEIEKFEITTTSLLDALDQVRTRLLELRAKWRDANAEALYVGKSYSLPN